MEFDNNVPIYIQVINDIKREIAIGSLALGSKLLSARDLAIKYKINPNTANRIYKELEVEELCFTKRGLGTFVTEDQSLVRRIREEMASELFEGFIQGMKNLGFTKLQVLEMIEEKYDKGQG